jgi:hypothetical protein
MADGTEVFDATIRAQAKSLGSIARVQTGTTGDVQHAGTDVGYLVGAP